MMTTVHDGLELTWDKVCTNITWKGRKLKPRPQQYDLLVKLSQGPIDPKSFGKQRASVEVAVTRLRQFLTEAKVPLTVSYASTGKWQLESTKKKARPKQS